MTIVVSLLFGLKISSMIVIFYAENTNMKNKLLLPSIHFTQVQS